MYTSGRAGAFQAKAYGRACRNGLKTGGFLSCQEVPAARYEQVLPENLPAGDTSRKWRNDTCAKAKRQKKRRMPLFSVAVLGNHGSKMVGGMSSKEWGLLSV
jgi:hypothetical protein